MRPPKYCHFRPRNKGYVRLDGKRLYLPGQYQSPESLAAYRKILQDRCPGYSEIPTTVYELSVMYLDHCESSYPGGKNGEYGNIKSAIKRFLVRHRDTPITDVGPKKMTAFRYWLVEEGTSPQYANATASRIVRMFKWGVSQEFFEESVYRSIATSSALRDGNKKNRKPSARWRDVRRVIRLAHPQIAAMLKTQWLVGCRPGEVCAMMVDDIEIKGSVWKWTPSKHKNKWRGKRLSYFLGPLAQSVLRPWVESAVDGVVFSPRRTNKRFGKVYSVITLQSNIKRICKKHSIPYFAPHQIRHSKATRLRAIYGIEMAQLSLGLSSIETAEIYSDLRDRKARKIAERF